jgi:exodeoxyribonuclease V alpha subunit
MTTHLTRLEPSIRVQICPTQTCVRGVILWIEWLDEPPSSPDEPRRARLRLKAPAVDDPNGDAKSFEIVGAIRPGDAELANLIEIDGGLNSSAEFTADNVRVDMGNVSVAFVATIASVHYRAPEPDNNFTALGLDGVDGFHSVAGSIDKDIADKEGARARFRGVPRAYTPKGRRAVPVQSMTVYAVNILDRELSDPFQLGARRAGKVLTADRLAALTEAFGQEWPREIARDPDTFAARFPRWRAETKAALCELAYELVALDKAEIDMLAAGMTRGDIKSALARLKKLPFDVRLKRPAASASGFDARLLLASGHVTMLQARDANASAKFFRAHERVTDAMAAIWHELALGRERSGEFDDWREDIRAGGSTAFPLPMLAAALWRRWKIEVDATHAAAIDPPEIETLRSGGASILALKRAVAVERTLFKIVEKRVHAGPPASQTATRPRLTEPRDPGTEPEALRRAIDGQFDEAQRSAVEMALASRVGIIAGPPGVGKTTVCRAIVAGLGRTLGVTLSNRAARVLADKAGCETMTTRRFLMKVRAAKAEGRDSDEWRSLVGYDALILDECSMLSSTGLHDLMRFADLIGCGRIVLVGDPEQLQPIEEGRPFADLIEGAERGRTSIPFVRLSTNYRTDSAGIVALADDIRAETFTHAKIEAGSYPAVVAEYVENDEAALVAVLVRYQALLSAGAQPRDIAILSPFKKPSLALSTVRINIAIRDMLGFDPARAARGEIVIGVRNDFDRNIINGARGVVTQAGSSIIVEFEGLSAPSISEGKDMKTGRALPLGMDFGYASTIHKAQGSEFEHVIVVIDGANDWLLRKSALYTAVTRARSGLTIIGDLVAAEAMSRSPDRRTTVLQTLLGLDGPASNSALDRLERDQSKAGRG